MTDIIVPALSRADAAARRRGGNGQAPPGRRDVPVGPARSLEFPAQMRAELVERDGKQLQRLDGYASTTEKPYEMWDWAGPYLEVIDAGAFDATLAAQPDVAFLLNHRGVTMARTTNNTLELSVDALGLRSVAYLNPQRQDVRDLLVAIEDKNVTEMSFAFMLEDGEWSADFETFRIKKVDINRGDVSAVNYGANPYTSIAARSREIMRDLDSLPAGAVGAAMHRLAARSDAPRTLLAGPPQSDGGTGMSVTQLDAWIATVQAR